MYCVQEDPASWPGIFFHLDALNEINITFSKKIRNAIWPLIMISFIRGFLWLTNTFRTNTNTEVHWCPNWIWKETSHLKELTLYQNSIYNLRSSMASVMLKVLNLGLAINSFITTIEMKALVSRALFGLHAQGSLNFYQCIKLCVWLLKSKLQLSRMSTYIGKFYIQAKSHFRRAFISGFCSSD